ncbi:hypothetical protein MycrhDRAFT_7012, partial [Mycolicibacterium rhodesiae JS60]
AHCAAEPADAAAVALRRQRSAIPEGKQHRPKWQMALEMIDELIGWGRTPPVVTADAGYGETTAFRQGLTDRKIGYVVHAPLVATTVSNSRFISFPRAFTHCVTTRFGAARSASGSYLMAIISRLCTRLKDASSPALCN